LKHNPQTIIYFNNCRNRDHIALYGSGVFFDLNNSGKQAAQARDLIPGQLCAVASYSVDGQVTFNWYSFTHETLLPNEYDEMVRVFFGRYLDSETLPKSRAAHSVRYSMLFNCTGDFKQVSVCSDNLSTPDLPTGVKRGHLRGTKGAKHPKGGAGFGDPVENKLVEAAAIRAVKKSYEQEGWLVRSVEREKCGFDLQCSKDGLFEDVEVKGSRSPEVCFIITAGEVRQAKNNVRFFLMVVTSALSTVPKITKYSGEEFFRRFKISAIQYRAELQQ